jgi:hypothetical protein
MYHSGNLRVSGRSCDFRVCAGMSLRSVTDLSSGVTHLTVTVVVIMFELTGALTYILPIMVGWSWVGKRYADVCRLSYLS